MRKIKLIITIIAITAFSNKINAQATNGVPANNNFVAGNFLGWNTTNGVNPLQIRTNSLPLLRRILCVSKNVG